MAKALVFGLRIPVCGVLIRVMFINRQIMSTESDYVEKCGIHNAWSSEPVNAHGSSLSRG